MENQFSPGEMSVSNITALSNAKEVKDVKKSKISAFILIVMIAFTILLVFLSVYNFEGAVKPQKTHNVATYNNQVQQMAK